MTLLPIAKLRHLTRSILLSMIKRAGDHLQRSSGLKRFVLRFLGRYPGLKQKLRSIYLGCRFDDQSHPFNLTDPSSCLTMNLDRHTSDIEALMSHGVNSHQRSPLEAHFYVYRDTL